MNRKTFLQKLGLIAGAAIAAPVIAKEVVEASSLASKPLPSPFYPTDWSLLEDPTLFKKGRKTGKSFSAMIDAYKEYYRRQYPITPQEVFVSWYSISEKEVKEKFQNHPQRGNLFDV